MAEVFAVQLSTLTSVSDNTGIHLSVSAFVNRSQDVAAAALIAADGTTIAEYDDLAQLQVNTTALGQVLEDFKLKQL